ncbi:MAG TPA: hypothetical protein VIL46_17690, partial [Gemmataceae bacterium]
GKGLLAELDKQKETLHQRRKEMWKEAWEKQKHLYTWPKALAHLQSLRFGSDIHSSDRDQFIRGNRVYLGEYKNLADVVKPTQFLGGSWESVLRHVAEWRRGVPTSEEVWLALEDLWVQREILNIIDRVNDTIARFEPVPGKSDDKAQRTFRSRIWQVELTLADEGPDRVLKGKLTNVTDRLQALGAENTMYLKVWLNENPRSEPFLFAVEGDFVKAGETVPVKPIDKHKLDPDTASRATGIYRVEQVFDRRTVPVKRIDSIGLGYPSARTIQYLPLKMTAFSQKAVEELQAQAGTAGGESGSRGMVPGGPTPDGMGAMPGMAGPGGATSTDVTPNGLVRGRYIDTTDQVRRMPVGVLLVVDQAYLQDVMVAFANSPLRFQNTQFHWTRFRGSLSGGGGMYGTGGMPGYPGDPTGEGAVAPGAAEPTPDGEGAVVGPGTPGPGIVGPPVPGMGMPTYPGMQRPTAGDPTAGNLVHFYLYGTASLYNEFQEDPDATSVAGASGT